MSKSIYWKWEKAVPVNICNMLLDSFEIAVWKSGAVGFENSYSVNLDIRNNDVFYLPTNHWLEGILYNHARYANKNAGWDYKFESVECVQIAKYDKNEYYNWHRDEPLVNTLNPNIPPRKISVVLQLNDPSEYSGGGLELEDDCDKPMGSNILENQGDLIVFPSTIKHRAIEVTEGTRYSATYWLHGDNFK
jgi:PKHD-type hydroxylase